MVTYKPSKCSNKSVVLQTNLTHIPINLRNAAFTEAVGKILWQRINEPSSEDWNLMNRISLLLLQNLKFHCRSSFFERNSKLIYMLNYT